MDDHHITLSDFRIEPGSAVDLSDRPTRLVLPDDLKDLGDERLKKEAKRFIKTGRKAMAAAQELLYADDRYALLIILQGMDASGKDGTIKHVMRGVNPQGCQVTSFKAPSDKELDHTFLWRSHPALPARGNIGIFNRSYYEEVLIVRVHDHVLASQKLPSEVHESEIWYERFDDINNFEHHLVRNGTRVLKFFLHISKEEQRRRFMDRLTEPDKHWKFSESDLSERPHWERYQRAFESALSATSTPWAPWMVVPGDHKWVMRAIISKAIVDELERLPLAFPQPSEEKLALIERAREELSTAGEES